MRRKPLRYFPALISALNGGRPGLLQTAGSASRSFSPNGPWCVPRARPFAHAANARLPPGSTCSRSPCTARRPGRLSRTRWPLLTTATEAGDAHAVMIRRVRVVSEPLSDYLRWEHACTDVNISAGEDVRWLPRTKAAGLLLPGADCWVSGHRVVRLMVSFVVPALLAVSRVRGNRRPVFVLADPPARLPLMPMSGCSDRTRLPCRDHNSAMLAKSRSKAAKTAPS